MSISEYLKTADDGKEKHIPDINVKDCSGCGELSVTIQVGKEVLHPSLAEHFIKTVTLYGLNKEKKLEEIVSFNLAGGLTVPSMRASVKKDRYIKLIATSFCNMHGLWENETSL